MKYIGDRSELMEQSLIIHGALIIDEAIVDDQGAIVNNRRSDRQPPTQRLSTINGAVGDMDMTLDYQVKARVP